MTDRTLTPASGSTRGRKRLGRGNASGQGRTAGRGMNGYHSRSGSKRLVWREGGQMPLQRRIPKRGFSNAPFRKEIQIVNLETLERLGVAKIDPAVLQAKGAIKKAAKPVKILGMGELKSGLEVTAHAFSKAAVEKIEKAGGKAILC
ncbi:MAG: 50S ribosomal protein L15 [Candidatus Marinimicrobia bacterium]|nr:50S ribosomal protein L15 [Candidatus Neomarinimicrobiota bacterium]